MDPAAVADGSAEALQMSAPPPTADRASLSPELQRAATRLAVFPGACSLHSFQDVLRRPQLQALELLGELQRKGLVQVTITPTTALRLAAWQAREEQPTLEIAAEVQFSRHVLKMLHKWSADFQTGAKWQGAFKAARERARDVNRLLDTLTVAATELRGSTSATASSSSRISRISGCAAADAGACSSSGGREAWNLQSVCTMATYLTSSVSHLLAALGMGDEFGAACDTLQAAVHPHFHAPGVQLAYSIFNSRAMDSRLGLEMRKPRRSEVDGVQVLRLYLSYRVAKKEQPGHEAIAALEAWAGGLFLNGRVEEARARFSEALDLWRQLYGEEHPRVAAATASVACCAAEEGDGAEAEALHRRALELQHKLLGERHPDAISTLVHVARDMQLQDKLQAALDTYERGIAWQSYAVGYGRRGLAADQHAAGGCAMELGRYEDARTHLRAALDDTGVRDKKTAAYIYFDLACAAKELQQYDLARIEFDLAHLLHSTHLGDSHPDTLQALCCMAECCAAQGEYAKAGELYARAAQLHRAAGARDEDVAYALCGQGDALDDEGKYAEAEQVLREALALYRRARVYSMDVIYTLNVLGATLYNQGRYAEAERAHRGVLHTRMVVLGPDDADTDRSWRVLHDCVRQQLDQWGDW